MRTTEILMALGSLLAMLTAILAVTYMILWFKLPKYARKRRGTSSLRLLWYSSKVVTALASVMIAGELDLYMAPVTTQWWGLTRLTAVFSMLLSIIASLSRLVYELWQASLHVQFIKMAQGAVKAAEQCEHEV
jgi:hypothetical protein